MTIKETEHTKRIVNTDEFLSIVANNVGASVSDVRFFYDAILTTMYSLVFDGADVMLHGYGKVYMRPMHYKKAWDNIHKVFYIPDKPHYRFVWKVPDTLIKQYHQYLEEIEGSQRTLSTSEIDKNKARVLTERIRKNKRSK